MLIGYLFGKYTNVDHSAISKFAMMVLSPALIFSFLVRNTLSSSEMVMIIIAILLFTLLMSIITFLIMKGLGKGNLLSPSLLATVFPNTGNFGLPIILLAYGNEGFSVAIVIVVINIILMYSLGVYFASVEENDWRGGLRKLLFLPTTYATIAAIIVLIFDIPVPEFVYQPIKMIGDSMIPIIMLLLGIQLSRTSLKVYQGATLITSGIKVIIAPLVILVIVWALGIEGTLAKVLILQNSMPTAVVMTIIAAEYKANSEMVANVTILTTILSFFSITGLLYLL
jgi:malate permease and related proteins